MKTVRRLFSSSSIKRSPPNPRMRRARRAQRAKLLELGIPHPGPQLPLRGPSTKDQKLDEDVANAGAKSGSVSLKVDFTVSTDNADIASRILQSIRDVSGSTSLSESSRPAHVAIPESAVTSAIPTRSKGTAAGKGAVAPVQAIEESYGHHLPLDVVTKDKEVWANMHDRVERMQAAIGYQFNNRALCIEAMVQGWSGAKAPQSTLRRHHIRGSLAVIGDSVLRLHVSRGWCQADLSTGVYYQMHNVLSNRFLTNVVKHHEMEELFLYDKGHVFDDKSYGTAFESIVGAVLVDGGVTCTRRLLRHFGFPIEKEDWLKLAGLLSDRATYDYLSVAELMEVLQIKETVQDDASLRQKSDLEGPTESIPTTSNHLHSDTDEPDPDADIDDSDFAANEEGIDSRPRVRYIVPPGQSRDMNTDGAVDEDTGDSIDGITERTTAQLMDDESDQSKDDSSDQAPGESNEETQEWHNTFFKI